MCGIVGFYQPNQPVDTKRLEAMRESVAHRGPDGKGIWTDSEAGIGFGHRRLAIVDLSAAGHQPMLSPSGRFVLCFNGELYNHMDLRRELHGVEWTGHSDTETLCAAIDQWGLRGAVERCVGMFAIALWDRRERTLSLARDRLGEKPLYCGWQNGTFLFASELKALREHPAFKGDLDPHAVSLFLQYGYIPTPASIYAGIEKLPPGTILTLDSNRNEQRAVYWSLRSTMESGRSTPFGGSAVEARDQLEALLLRSVSGQSIADVPLGAFLSGGIDSSTIAALMQAQSSQPVKTFTIGFDIPEYNEADKARAIAQHLGTDHTELYVGADEALRVVPKLSSMFDEPFADSSAIPTFLVAELTRRHVIVSLSGDAGDELFGGYSRYFFIDSLATRLKAVPAPLRYALGRSMGALPREGLSAALGWLRPQSSRPLGYQLHLLADALAAKEDDDLYRVLISQWPRSDSGAMDGVNLDLPPYQRSAPHALMERMMAIDTLTYLPDDILCKVDRCAMAVSLETRVPFLDHRVVEFAWQLPHGFKVRDGVGKDILRQVLCKYVPRNLVEGPKRGFGVPLDTWLRGPLRGWADDLLSEPKLARTGLLPVNAIRAAWQQHLSGRHNWSAPLWLALTLQAWMESRA